MKKLSNATLALGFLLCNYVVAMDSDFPSPGSCIVSHWQYDQQRLVQSMKPNPLLCNPSLISIDCWFDFTTKNSGTNYKILWSTKSGTAFEIEQVQIFKGLTQLVLNFIPNETHKHIEKLINFSHHLNYVQLMRMLQLIMIELTLNNTGLINGEAKQSYHKFKWKPSPFGEPQVTSPASQLEKLSNVGTYGQYTPRIIDQEKKLDSN